MKEHYQFDYIRSYWKDYDYTILEYIGVKRTAGRNTKRYNNVIIMGDTETSKKKTDEIYQNHVVAWTISLNADGQNVATLYGSKPSDMVACIDLMLDVMDGDYTFIYFHNLSYDWVFLRKFFFRKWDYPKKQLNTKPHYPISIEFSNHVILKDSLILAQRGLDKWAKDMDVSHQKAVGKWDYDKLRCQDGNFSEDELEYIEHDTLAGVECLYATMKNLNKHIYSMPYTATGIPREQVRKIGKKYKAHERFIEQALDYDQLKVTEMAYHGGYTHANRHYLDTTIKGKVKCYDFASSYPYIMIGYKFPVERFTEINNCYIDDILKHSEKYAFIFNFIATGVKIKSDSIVMPTLQNSRAVKVINPVLDNGRILACEYVSIWLTEIDLKLIKEHYDIERHICLHVMVAKKGYLPRWFTDFVYQCFKDKTQFKGGDPVLYAIAKAKLNSLYGMCVQHPIREDIIEHYETGQYTIDHDKDMQDEYRKYVNRITSILPYQWGVWVTAYAMYNLFQLGKCARRWYYSDTDSVYGEGWNIKAVERYNAGCRKRLKDRGYDPIEHEGKLYYLGVAEHEGDSDTYTEFRMVGAKRYCGRNLKDGELHITVAGVPKVGAKCLNDDIDNFTTGMVFDGETTNKKTHTFFYVDDIYIDDSGNETGDSIDLSPCDYLLQSEYDIKWEDILYDKIEIQRYDLF